MSTFSINLETRSLLNVNREEYLTIEHIEQQLLESYTYAKLKLFKTTDSILEASGALNSAVEFAKDANIFSKVNRQTRKEYNEGTRKRMRDIRKLYEPIDGPPTLKKRLKYFNDDHNPMSSLRRGYLKYDRESAKEMRGDSPKPKMQLNKQRAKASGKALGVAAGLGTGGVLMKNASERVGVKADNAEALKDHADKMADYKASLTDD